MRRDIVGLIVHQSDSEPLQRRPKPRLPHFRNERPQAVSSLVSFLSYDVDRLTPAQKPATAGSSTTAAKQADAETLLNSLNTKKLSNLKIQKKTSLPAPVRNDNRPKPPSHTPTASTSTNFGERRMSGSSFGVNTPTSPVAYRR